MNVLQPYYFRQIGVLFRYEKRSRSISICTSLSLSLLVFYVTCDDISVIYVTAQMCRRTEEEVEVVPTVGLPRHRHFAGFFNVPVLHRHGTNLFIR